MHMVEYEPEITPIIIGTAKETTDDRLNTRDTTATVAIARKVHKEVLTEREKVWLILVLTSTAISVFGPMSFLFSRIRS